MGLMYKIRLGFVIFVMATFFTVKTVIFLGTVLPTPLFRGVEYLCFLIFSVIFWVLLREYDQKIKKNLELGRYTKKLNEVLINISHDP